MRNLKNLLPPNVLNRMLSDHVFPTGYVGQFVCPLVDIGDADGLILKADPNRKSIKRRPYKSGASPVYETFEGSSVPISTIRYQTGVKVTKDQIKQQERRKRSKQLYLRDQTIEKLNAAALGREVAIFEKYGDPANWGSDNKSLPPVKWDAANSHPFADMKKIIKESVIKPNRVTFSYDAFDLVQNHDDFLDMFAPTVTPAYNVAMELIRGYLGVQTVAVVGEGSITDKYLPAPGKDLTSIFEDGVIFTHVQDNLLSDVRFSDDVTHPIAFVNPTRDPIPVISEGPWYEEDDSTWRVKFDMSDNPTTLNENVAHFLNGLKTP